MFASIIVSLYPKPNNYEKISPPPRNNGLRRNALVSICFLTLAFTACQREVKQVNQPAETVTASNSFTALRLQQIAAITQEVMRDASIEADFRKALLKKSAGKPGEEESIYFREITQERFTYAQTFYRAFKKRYMEIFNSGAYPNADRFTAVTEAIQKEIASGGSSNPNMRSLCAASSEYDYVFWTDNGTQIYFPYSENFDRSTETPSFAYDPGDDRLNIPVSKTLSNGRTTSVSADEAYVQLHPVYVINQGPDEAFRCGMIDSVPPPPPSITCRKLDYNTISDAVDDRYVVSSTMPKINLTKNYRSWFGGGNYLKLYQAYTVPHNLNIDPSTGQLPVGDTSRLIYNTGKIKRKYTGDVNHSEHWVDFNQVWSGDWRLMQYNHVMILAYQGGFLSGGLGKINYEVTAGLKWDTLSKRYLPSFNIGAKVSGTLDLDGKWFSDGTVDITRRDMLSHVWGDNFGLGTAKSIGLDPINEWSVRPCGHMNFYFAHTICY